MMFPQRRPLILMVNEGLKKREPVKFCWND